MEKKTTTKAEAFIDQFDEAVENEQALSEEKLDALAGHIDSRDTLDKAIPLLVIKNGEYKEAADKCDANIKTWQASKKIWTARQENLIKVIGRALGRLGISSSIKTPGGTLAVSNRSSLEVDEAWLLGQYEALRGALQAQLPDYVKVSLAVDKNKLAAHLKQDAKMLIDNPEQIHTRVSTSITLK